MKEFIIKQFLSEGSDYDTYTIFKNPDKEMKKRVATFPQSTSFKTWTHEIWEVTNVEEDGEIKCINGKNIKFFPKEEVSKNLIEDRREKIKDEFNVVKNFVDIYGTLYLNLHDGIEKHYYKEASPSFYGVTEDMTDEQKNERMSLSNRFMKEHGYEVQFTYSKPTLNLSEYGQTLNLKIREGYSRIFINYTDDGDFINRDYNMKIHEYTQEKKSLKKIYEKFKRDIIKLGEIGYTEKGEKFYTENYCLEPYIAYWFDPEKMDPLDFSIVFTSAVDKNSYKSYRNPRIKKPAKLKYMSGEEFFLHLEEKYLGEIIKLIKEEDNEI